MTGQDRREPKLGVEALFCDPAGTEGCWSASWRIRNLSQQRVEIVSVWLPHDNFASRRRVFNTPLRLPSMDSEVLEIHVACDELPGSVVENAFVILQLEMDGRTWRVFARHRIALDDAGVPHHKCQSVTVHPVGFTVQSGSEPPTQA